MDKKSSNSPQEEGNEMATVLENKKLTIQEMLNKISAKAETLTGEDRMIELDIKNPNHSEWFEEE